MTPEAGLSIRSRILAGSRAVGLEPRLRAAQRALASPGDRRNRSDDEHLAIVLATVLREDANCIDIGANVGAITDVICALAPNGRHIAIEPLPELADDLRQRHPGLDVQCCALSDAAGRRTFIREIGSPSRSGFRRQDDDGSAAIELSVEVRRLDDIVPDDRDIAFIKLDVEGAEAEVLLGALETIERCRPVIAFEHGASAVANYGTSHQVIHEFLADRGMVIFDMDGNGPFTRAEFDRVADPPGDRWNFLARPL